MTVTVKLDAILDAPAARKNRDHIFDAIVDILPSEGTIFEVGSGGGLHIAHFAEKLPHLTFQPSDYQEAELRSIEQRRQLLGLDNLNTPIHADLLEKEWPIQSADAVIAINIVHITPWETTLALLDHAAQLLPRGGPLYLYGPFHRSTETTAPSNLEFDKWLKSKDPAFGIRHLDDISTHAQDYGFCSPQVRKMPANNLSVVFSKT